ncbi:hypothetical protein [Parafilimonas terrae]|uniref:Outer membrane protein beta-barrel domain-containing protein n=1 Tax=Parafilimonas terrae TaxID=1465490 RepID=A0A1I5TIQ6_9BACT|nr:hypothetical protein [Parafilimonas terrae]SFP82761.1 hypothetical protein SAMN05444277_102147 [Parafilimonas terrae]
MNKHIFFFTFITALLILNTNNAHAQKSDEKLSFGFGLEAGLLTGDFKDVYNFAAGITARASYKLGPGFVTLTSGGIAFLPKNFDDEDLKAGLQIPVKAGYKYVFAEHFFVMGELGFSTMKYYFEDYDGGLVSVNQSGFTYAPAVGAQFGSFEIGVRYESTALSGSSLSAGLIRLGFNF